MQPSVVYEIIGYAASVLVAVSLMMSSILKLRVINLIGALFFTVYGLLIQAYPVAVVNFFIVLIDLYYLYEIFSAKEYIHLLPMEADSEYLRFFLDFYERDIHRFIPGLELDWSGENLIFFALRNTVPAGLVIGRVKDETDLYIQLDYAIPGYRDLKIGRYIYQKNAQVFRQRGIRRIYTSPGAPSHGKYLRRMGFQPSGGGLYCLEL
jgi:GNAT superfamily N-acetyltransferase